MDVSSIPDNMFPPGLVFESSPFSLVMSQEWLLEAAHYSNITPTPATTTHMLMLFSGCCQYCTVPDLGTAAVLPCHITPDTTKYGHHHHDHLTTDGNDGRTDAV